MNNTNTLQSAPDGSQIITLTTTVPVWLSAAVGEMAAEDLVSKSVFIRSLLLEHVREERRK
jgi:hypothetical protein